MPSVAPKSDPMTLVLIQYWFEAGMVALADIAHKGRPTLDRMDRARRVILNHLLRDRTRTGWMIFAVEGLPEATSLFAHALRRGSESHGVSMIEPRAVANSTLTMSVWSMTSGFLCRSVYRYTSLK